MFFKLDSELLALVVLGLSCEYVFFNRAFLSNWICLCQMGFSQNGFFPKLDSRLLALVVLGLSCEYKYLCFYRVCVFQLCVCHFMLHCFVTCLLCRWPFPSVVHWRLWARPSHLCVCVSCTPLFEFYVSGELWVPWLKIVAMPHNSGNDSR